MDTVDRAQQVARRLATAAAGGAQGGTVGAGPRGGGGGGWGAWGRRGARPRAARGVGPGMAGAPRSARGARGPPGGAARSRIARVFRRADPQRDRPAPGPAARHREDAVADRPGEAGGGVGARKGLAGMTDWLGMAAHPQPPRPELKARVVARALASRRRGAWVGAAAGAPVPGGGGGGVLG